MDDTTWIPTGMYNEFEWEPATVAAYFRVTPPQLDELSAAISEMANQIAAINRLIDDLVPPMMTAWTGRAANKYQEHLLGTSKPLLIRARDGVTDLLADLRTALATAQSMYEDDLSAAKARFST